MAKLPKRRFDFSYMEILAKKLAAVPAWRDLAKGCDEVLGAEIDQRRRKLEKIRDSIKYRRGDTLTKLVYKPEPNKQAMVSGQNILATIEPGTVIPVAKVKNVIKNLAYFMHSDATDYLDLEFEYDNQTIRWLMAIDLPQERDALLKNAYIMGFDFFNTKLSDEDLQRLYEALQMYWPESGADDLFMKFIGYIKNTRFDLIPLWSYETDNDNYPVLIERPVDAVSVKEGGPWYLTSHVEIRYDLRQFNDIYTLNLDDLETLFYYFAPIILVLERIVGSLEIEGTIAALGVMGATVNEYNETENPTDIIHKSYDFAVAGETLIDYNKDDKLPIIQDFDSTIGYKTVTGGYLVENGLTAYSGYEEGNEGQDGLIIPLYASQIVAQTSYNYRISDLYFNSNLDSTSTITHHRKTIQSAILYDYSCISTS